MPTVLRLNGFRFFFFSNEGNEPPHIHVERGECYAKYWLGHVEIAKSIGFRSHELTKLHRMVIEYVDLFEEKWHEHFDSTN